MHKQTQQVALATFAALSLLLLLLQCVLAVVGVGLGPLCAAAGDDLAAGGPLAAAAARQVRLIIMYPDSTLLCFRVLMILLYGSWCTTGSSSSCLAGGVSKCMHRDSAIGQRCKCSSSEACEVRI
jgi:hypothetical protein